ncbi:hypothetical protein GBA65_14610 [Rubrobacter marinus]|uniref:Uncharacterized protein n=1 Tax=Rubrobacter marinus TaxID=2653852 RepID=A0A6G8PZD2_9ACTN|nr:hypothetical protein [Rubrobacter marinus]QIN79545.1 hypothetical protein GBA65_14610 [Rubrobacter marinus]
MRTFGRWLLQRPVRLIELCSATVLLLAAAFFVDAFGTAVVTYGLATLLFVLLLKSFLDGDRLH